jgi:hypothetical protein
MRRARFPARGSIVTRRLVEAVPAAPAENEDAAAFARRRAQCEALEDVEIDIMLASDQVMTEIRHGYTIWQAQEQRRLGELERQGAAPPSISMEGLEAIKALHEQCVRRLVVCVRGLDFGEVASERMDVERLIACLRDERLLADVATVARDAQSPTPTQLER